MAFHPLIKSRFFFNLLLIISDGAMMMTTMMLMTTTTTIESKALMDEKRSSRRSSSQDNIDTMDYLAEYGYLSKANLETGALRSEEELVTAVKQFQKKANIRQTGVLDPQTTEFMAKPRCGIPDMNSSFVGGQNKPQEFTLGPSKWQKTDLTYRILNYSPDLYWGDASTSFADAFRVWSDVSPLTFREVSSGEADILISFASGYHNDGYAFDGKGHVLAHAFPPGEGRGGDAHFDDDETWTFKSQEGTNLFTVAAHEFGHSLGIYHSNVPGALMFPWYQGYNPNIQLHSDDIQAIETLYGGKSDERRTIPPSPPKTSTPAGVTIFPASKQSPRTTTALRPIEQGPPDPCTTDLDAVTTVRGEVFAFKGQWFWRLDKKGVIEGYPVLISRFWDKFPTKVAAIDAVYERPEDKRIIFFNGDRFWEFHDRFLAPRFPIDGRSITELGLPSSVRKIDAALVWGFNRRTYLFSGYNYWRMDSTGFRVEKGYPKATDFMWSGIPIPFDASFTHTDGKTYFFKGSRCWALDDANMRTMDGYPRPIGQMWLGMDCSVNLSSSANMEVTTNKQILFLPILLSFIFMSSVAKKHHFVAN